MRTFLNVYNEYVNQPLALNSVLWFLVVLFDIQMIFYVLKSLIKKVWLLALISIIFTIIGEILIYNNINGLFFIPLSLRFFMWYTFGSLFGRKLIDIMKIKDMEVRIFVIGVILLIILSLISYKIFLFEKIDTYLRTLIFIPIAFVFFKWCYKLKIMKPLNFFGKNSLIVLGTHRTIFWFFTFVILRMKPNWEYNGMLDDYSFYLAMFVFTCVIDYFIIKFLNKYFPWFVAKKDLIYIKSD